jgi:hypothetical protein
MPYKKISILEMTEGIFTLEYEDNINRNVRTRSSIDAALCPRRTESTCNLPSCICSRRVTRGDKKERSNMERGGKDSKGQREVEGSLGSDLHRKVEEDGISKYVISLNWCKGSFTTTGFTK